MSAHGFPRSARLLKAAEFEHVFAQPRRSADRYFTVLARASKCPRARLGLAISKRQVPSAVLRNRLKRLARERFRQLCGTVHGLDLVIMARAAAGNAARPSLNASLDHHLKSLTQRDDAAGGY
ncbi:MAG: ribonuclease P protein component [Chromatiaceae bacterium]|nr:ribonuclease P protein component [Gammaproteobacteria bacterium]MCP5300613.1 ribonuclease P protein component [Chromatiaceae bacterium]MCP5422685.1 ribonuclease P protein component [Chromatiaceae bacterium]